MTTLYGLDNCDTCRKVRKWLRGFSITHTFVDYRNQPPSAETLLEWAEQRGGFAALVNKSSTTWRQLPETCKTPVTDEQWLALLHQYPVLIRRPLLVMADGRIHQGFSEAGFKTLFGVNA